MKRLFLMAVALCCGMAMSSCIDESFDLSDVNTDDVTIGNDDSEFLLPLATVNVTSADICQKAGVNEISLKQMYDEVSIWFPTTLPDNATYIEIERLINDQEYFETLYNALYEELLSNEAKRQEVCLYVVSEYRGEFLEALENHSNAAINVFAQELNGLSNADAATLLSNLIVNSPDLVKDAFSEVSAADVADLELKDIEVDVPSINISDEVMDMLMDNIDPATEQNPVNALYLYGSVESDLPFMFVLRPEFVGTNVDFGDMYVDMGNTKIDEVRIYREDLQKILNGVRFETSIVIYRYYPYEPFNNDSAIKLHLGVRKTGGLKI